MGEQLYWEDVEVEGEIPPVPKIATSQMLVKWAGASGDFNPLHYEDTYAASQGVGRPIIHGQLKRAWLIQLLTDWIGEEGTLKKFSCHFRAVDYLVGFTTCPQSKGIRRNHTEHIRWEAESTSRRKSRFLW